MAEISKLRITELDFDTIKNNLKDYFSSQSEFTDHDFEGSAISILVDVLAYNTHYNAYYMNMLASEAFLDSAQLRDSVVAKASMLGYTPRSAKGSRATVDITVTPTDSPASITIDKNTQFTSTVNGSSYTFCTADSTTITPVNGVYTASSVELVQGEPLTFRYTANTANVEQRFLLPNANTDTSTLTVTIQESLTDTNTAVYTLASDITTINSTSNVYFLKESTSGFFEVQFGDGVLGRRPTTGNLVLLSALVTDGEITNGANSFSADSTVGGYSTVSVATVSQAVGGQAKESIESIKFNAPKNFETQNRAVTTDDYKKIIESNLSGFDSVSVWGGQDNDTPFYGRVYISAKPAGSIALSDAQKQLITDLISSYRIVSVTPIVVDPDILDVVMSITVKYDSRLTTLTSGAIATKVIDTIQNYKNNNLLKFGSIFRYSVLSRLIDSTDVSILNNLSTVTVKKGINPSTTRQDDYTIRFNNPIYNPSDIYEGAVTSTTFTYTDADGTIYSNCYLEDKNGVMRIVYISGSEKIVLVSNAGAVDYLTGIITLSSFKPDSFTGSLLDFTIEPSSNDLVPVRNQLFDIKNANIVVIMQDDAGTGTTVTSSSVSGDISSTTVGTANGQIITF